MTTQTADETTTVRPIQNSEELRRATNLMIATHQANPVCSPTWLQTHSQTYPHFKREHTRIVTYNGELAGALRISTDTIRVGEARLKLGGLGWISIAPQYINTNAHDLLIDQTMHYLQEHRYHLTMIFSHQGHDEPPKFVDAMLDYTVHVDCTRKRPMMPWTRRTRPVKPGDIPRLQRIHASNSEIRSCSIVRDRAHFTNAWERIKNMIVFTDSKGKVEGYLLLRYGTGKLHVEEIEAVSEVLFREILLYTFDAAQTQLIHQLVFHFSPTHPVLVLLSRHVPAEAIEINMLSVGKINILDLDETLESMIPEWENRIAQSLLREFDAELTLLIDGVAFRIRTHFGVIDIARQMGRNKFSVSMEEFSQLFTGYAELSEILTHERRLITREGRALLELLFPARTPFMPLLDRF